MNSVIERVLTQLREERDQIDAAIRRLEGETDEEPRVKRLPRREPTARVQCKHGCGKEFKADSHWLQKHEADCSFVVAGNGRASDSFERRAH